MINFFALIPPELIENIYHFIHPNFKENFSIVDLRINRVVLNVVKSIMVFTRQHFSYKEHPSNIPVDILIKVIQRYSKLNEIVFVTSKHLYSVNQFRITDRLALDSLTEYLKNNNVTHPFSKAKKIQFYEILEIGSFQTLSENNYLNTLFLNSIGHSHLESVKIKAYHIRSNITGVQIQPLLQNSPNLKKFTYDSFQSKKNITLDFTKQTQLLKVKLLYWLGNTSTIESLKNCNKLVEIVIDPFPKKINDFFLNPETKFWNLSRLEGILLKNNDELKFLSKNFPNLECLNLKMRNITDNGMESLGENCPNLKILHFNNPDVTDLGIAKLTQHLPKLKILSFDNAYKITEVGVAGIARNCKGLQFLEIVNYQKIGKFGFVALAENCPNLKVLGFSYGGPVDIKSMYDIVYKTPKLCYAEFYSISNISEQKLEDFYKHFPHLIKTIPTTTCVKKLNCLIK